MRPALSDANPSELGHAPEAKSPPILGSRTFVKGLWGSGCHLHYRLSNYIQGFSVGTGGELSLAPAFTAPSPLTWAPSPLSSRPRSPSSSSTLWREEGERRREDGRRREGTCVAAIGMRGPASALRGPASLLGSLRIPPWWQPRGGCLATHPAPWLALALFPSPFSSHAQPRLGSILSLKPARPS